MCSQNQPKMFGGAQPLGSGGNFQMPTTYQSNAAPTADVGFTPPPPAPTPAPTGGAAGVAPNPGQSPQPTLPGGGGQPGGMQQWWQRWNAGGSRGVLPPMAPGGGALLGRG